MSLPTTDATKRDNKGISEITEYIEIFHYRQRRHSRLGYLAPAVFAKQFYRQQGAA